MSADLLALLDQLDEARAAALEIRSTYPSLPVLQQKGANVEAVWSDGADMTWIECEEAADAALIVAAVNALPKLTAALRAVLDKHQPIEWQECDDDGVPDLDKPLPPFCHGCTDDEYVNAVEFGDTIERDSPVIDYPCPTVQAITAALTPEPAS